MFSYRSWWQIIWYNTEYVLTAIEKCIIRPLHMLCHCDDVTWTPCSLKSLVIRLSVSSLCGPTSNEHQNPHYWSFVRGIHRWPMNSPVTGEFPVWEMWWVFGIDRFNIWQRAACLWLRKMLLTSKLTDLIKWPIIVIYVHIRAHYKLPMPPRRRLTPVQLCSIYLYFDVAGYLVDDIHYFTSQMNITITTRGT